MTGGAQLNRSIAWGLTRLRGFHLLTVLVLAWFAAGAGQAHAQSFTISGPNYPVAIWAGGPATTFPVTVTVSGGGSTGGVVLSYSNAPAGFIVSPPPCWNGGSTPSGGTCQVTIEAPSTLAAGTYDITITGSNSSGTSSVTVPIYVQNFSIVATPASLSVAPGSSGTTTISNTESCGPGDTNIVLTYSGLPAGVTPNFSSTTMPCEAVGATLTFSVASTAATGTYTITITATVAAGATGTTATVTLTRSTTVTLIVAPPSFSLAGPPTFAGVDAGGSTTFGPISTTLYSGFDSSVSLTASNLPSGVTIAFQNSTIAAPGSGSSNITISASSAVPDGEYSITITGTGGGWTASTTISLYVLNFTLSASPAAITVGLGSSGTSAITATMNPGPMEGVVTLSASGMPSGVTVSFVQLTSPPVYSGTATMTVNVASTTTAGTYPITVTGTSGSVVQTTTVTLTVPSPSFALPAQMGPYDVMAGSNLVMTVNNTVTGGFDSAIAMSASTTQSGLTATISPSTVAAPGSGTYTLTLSAAASVPAGQYPVTLTGTGGGLTRTITWEVYVTNFTVSASPASLTVSPGSNGTSTITLNNSYGTPSASTMSLSAAGQPSGVTVGFSPATAFPNTTTNSTMTVTVPTSTPPGIYSITVTGTMSGGPTQSTTITLTVSGVTAGASPTSISVAQGNSGSVSVTAYGYGSGAPALTVAGLPTGVTDSFTYAGDTCPWCTQAALTFNVASTTLPGSYPITIMASSTGLTSATTIITLNIPGFTVPNQWNAFGVLAGGSLVLSGDIAYETQLANVIGGGFNAPITMSASSSQSGLTATFNPNPIAAPGSGSYSVTIDAAASVPSGSYPLTVTGTGGGATASATWNIWVENFTISVLPTAVSVLQGSSGTATITAGFPAGPVDPAPTFSATGQPSGVTVSFGSLSGYNGQSATSTMTITVASGTTPGVYPITVTGAVSGGTTHTITVNLTVQLLPTITLTSSPNPSTYGNAVTLTATVTSGDTNPVTFNSGSTVLGTSTPNSSGIATLSISNLSAPSDSITATIANGGVYATNTSAAATQVVNQATPTISAWPAASAITYGQTLASSSLSGGTTSVSGTFTWTTPSASPVAGAPSESVTFTPSNTTDYKTVTGAVNVTVNQATPIVTAWPVASPITYGQTLSSSTLSGGSASVAGTFAWTTPSTAPSAGAQSEGATFTPINTADYKAVTGSVSLVVSPATPTLSMTSSGSPSTYGNPVTLTVAVSNGDTNAITFYSYNSNNGSTLLGTAIPGSNGTATLATSSLIAGSNSITANIASSGNYNAATSPAIVQTVNPAMPAINWPAPSQITYGTALTATQLDATASVQGTFVYSPAPNSVLTAGTHTLSVTFTPANTLNYTTATASVQIVVQKANPAITWYIPSQLYYGTSVPAATTLIAGAFTYSPALNAPLVLGSEQFSYTFTPTDTQDYNTITYTTNATIVTNPTTTTVTLSPVVSWLGYPVLINATVVGAQNTIPSAGGNVSCTATPPAGSGNAITVSQSLGGATSFGQMLVTGLPITPTGTYYTVTCSFVSSNTSEYSSSNSNASPVQGTVISPPTPSTTTTAQLLTPRSGHQATMISTGGILVTGGVLQGNVSTDNWSYSPGNPTGGGTVLSSAEIYTTAGSVAAGEMTEPRWNHTATPLLKSGSGSANNVLITGGYNGSTYLASAEIYTVSDTPGSTGTFTPTSGPMMVARMYHTATELQDGEVLIVGGTSDGGNTIQSSAELFNPQTGTFTSTGNLNQARWMHTATLLNDGTVLITGGAGTGGTPLSSAEIYNPATRAFTLTGSMLQARSLAQATLLGDGTVLITGGAGSTCSTNYGYPNSRFNGSTSQCSLSEAEIYQPTQKTFTQLASSMLAGRYLHTATSLPDGTVLLAGGIDSEAGQNDYSRIEEIYNSSAKTFTQVGQLVEARWGHTATGFANVSAYNSASGALPGGVIFLGGDQGQTIGYATIGGANESSLADAESYGSSWLSASLAPKFVILGVMYAPPGTGSSMTYANQTQVGVTTSTANSFQNGLTLSLGFPSITCTTGSDSKCTLGGGANSGGSGGGASGSGSGGAGGGGGGGGSSSSGSAGGSGSGSGGGGGSSGGCGGSGGSGGGNSSSGASGSSGGGGGAGGGGSNSGGGGSGSGGENDNSVGFGWTYQSSNQASFSVTTSTGDCIIIPGPKNPNSTATSPAADIGVDHESDIIWVWLNPATWYTAASPTSLVWNGYATNPNDTNVAPGQMDIVPITVSQLDGSAASNGMPAIPEELQTVLDRNWDPIGYGGAGGLTSQDLQSILKADPFATLIQPGTASTGITYQAYAQGSGEPPIFDPHVPTLDPATGACGQRYVFNQATGQTFSYSPLSSYNSKTAVAQPLTTTYTINSSNTNGTSTTTTNTYQAGVSLGLQRGSGASNALTLANLLKPTNGSLGDTLAISNQWNPSTSNQSSTTQTLTIKNPSASSGTYSGPTQMQIWRDTLFGTYMFYPVPNDTTATLTFSGGQNVIQEGTTGTLTATITPAQQMQGTIPKGSITFYDGCTELGTASLSAAGVASIAYSPSLTSAGTHTINAVYSGDNNFFHNSANTLSLIVEGGPLLTLSAVSPASGAIGSTVTITGSNLGVGGTVLFDGVPALSTQVTWVSSTQVQAVVPVGALSGPVTVTVAGQSSNSVPFTVTSSSTATTSTLQLNPAVSWTGYPVTADVLVTTGNQAVPSGTVSCVSSPSTGVQNAAASVNPTTRVASVSINDEPVLPQGAQSSQSYSVTCTFSPANGSGLQASISNIVSGTVVPVPAASSNNTGQLIVPRENHQATLLPDGSVLITGGDNGKYAGSSEDGPFTNYLQSVEIFLNNTYSLSADMTTPRSMHQATLLSNSTGQVLITGGINSNGVLASAELYTPSTVPGAPGSFALTTQYDAAAGTFTAVQTNMNTPRFWHTATLLPNGKVLITGGTSAMGNFNAGSSSFMATGGPNGDPESNALATAELFDPLTGVFTYTSGPMRQPRTRHTATLLQDGTVLITGGMDQNGDAISNAEIYHPSTDTFTLVPSFMTHGRIHAQATRLGDGTVLITGGSVGAETNGGCPGFRTNNCALNDAEIYNPSSQSFSELSSNMDFARYSHTASLLPDGTVLIAGGFTNQYYYSPTNDGVQTSADTEEIYNPSLKSFTTITDLLDNRYNHTATTLPSGGVLLTGGIWGDMYGACPDGESGSNCTSPSSASNSELYQPPLQLGSVHPKFAVLDVMYAPPGYGSTVTYTDSTLVGTSTAATNSNSTGFTLSVTGTDNIKSINYNLNANLGFTSAQNNQNSYSVSTTTTDSTVVPGPVVPLLTTSPQGVNQEIDPGVNHEADIIWVWLNPENDYAVTSSNSLLWNGFATNQNDTNVSPGGMDVIPLTVAQLDGTQPLPADVLEVLDRDWDPISEGGAGPITPSDLITILQRDPFAVNTTAGTESTAPTNVPPGQFTNQYSLFDPNIPTSGSNGQCGGQRFTLSNQTFQYATAGPTNQAFSQTYSLQTNQATQSSTTVTDSYSVGVSLGVCFPASESGGCGPQNKASTYSVNLNLGASLTWSNSSKNSSNGQTLVTQALTIKNPLPNYSYEGPTQMQVWTDAVYGTYMFYPKATDTSVTLSSGQQSAQAGSNVTLTALVTPDPTIAKATTPSGTITFYDDCNVLGGGPQSLVNGVASVNTSWAASASGSHTIRAVYSGDANYFQNDSSALTQQVLSGANINLPYITQLQPASGSEGAQVQIAGENFGTSGNVTFNGVPATVNSWSQGSITVTVPAGATTGPVVVASNDYTSNAVAFTVLTASNATITTLALSPSRSSSGNPVSAVATISEPGGTTPFTGFLTCTVSTGGSNTSTPSVSVNSSTPSIVVQLLGVPTVPSGSSNPVSYNAVCNFTSNSSGVLGSISNVAVGTVSSSPGATTSLAASLNVPRENHQATPLEDGTVLITGGDNTAGAIATSEIYVNGEFSLAAQMLTARTGHQATLLSNSTGQVLVTGGSNGNGDVFSSAELFTPGQIPGSPGQFSETTLYDQAAGAYTSTVTAMNSPRTKHSATQLPGGKVLIVGGLDGEGNVLGSAELYDPTTGSFANSAGVLQEARYAHNATLLTNGTVLITGGIGENGVALNVAEIYNPATDSFSVTQNASHDQTFMMSARSGAQAVTLAGGTVMISGGINSSGTVLNSAEIYNPSSGIFSFTTDTGGAGTTSMIAARSSHTATLLPDGTVLLAGGMGEGGIYLSSDEIYNPVTGDFNAISAGMLTPRANQTSTLLQNGTVLLAGGADNGIILSEAEMTSETYANSVLFPKYMVLGVLYAPPGEGSTVTYSNSTQVGTTTSTDSNTSSAQTASISATINLAAFTDIPITVTPTVSWGHTFSADGASSYSFTTTTAKSLIVPGAVLAGTQTNKPSPAPISTGVDHSADLIQIWVNPATIYTQPPGVSTLPPGTESAYDLIWNGLASNPNDPNVAPGDMDVVTLSVSQLENPDTIPPELQAELDRNWDSPLFGGAGGISTEDIQTILQRDPFANNISFDPNVPVPDPLLGNQCSTRYVFDPVFGQTFPFGVLGNANQAFTQAYSLQSSNSTTLGTTTTDAYSVGSSYTLKVGLPNIVQVNANEANTVTFTNTNGTSKTNSSTVSQSLVIKNPLPSDNYNGPTQMQVWQDKVYGTFMFYPKTSDTNVTLTSSQSTAAGGETILLTANVTADPTVAASSNPPLTPTGSITFYDGCTVLGTVSLNSSLGVASLSVSSLASGTHSILATYSGDTHFLHNISEPLSEVISASATVGPFIAGLSQTSAIAGASVTITGEDFGNSGSVTFNGTSAITQSWSSSSITALVPAGATTGPVVVTTGEVASNGFAFTVLQPSGDTSTTVMLSPVTVPSGYPVNAIVTVTSSAGQSVTGTVSCTESSAQTGSLSVGSSPLGSGGSASIMIASVNSGGTQQLPQVTASGSSAAYTITCSYTDSSGLASSQSTAVNGTVIPVPAGTDSTAGNLIIAAENQQAGSLEDGSVLFTGGDNSSGTLSSAEIYYNGVFNNAAEMTTPRTGHQQTALLNDAGQVLITGGSNYGIALASAELFTPGASPGMPGGFTVTTQYNFEAGVFTNQQSYMTTPRVYHTATRLTNGQVLIVGGTDSGGNILSSAELFNPATGLFTAIPTGLNTARSGHNATLLQDGTVLITGGMGSNGVPVTTAEIYCPTKNTTNCPTPGVFYLTQSPMNVARTNAQATLLPSGMVLITGGQNGTGTVYNSAELYNPQTETFQYTQNNSGTNTFMTAARFGHTAILLYDGTVLIAGGRSNSTTTLSSMEVYNPSSGTFTLLSTPMETPRYNHTAIVLPAVGVLLTGGADTTTSATSYQSSADLYSPFTMPVGLHPKFMVLNIQYAPPGSGSTLAYSDATTIGTSTGTQNSFTHSQSLSESSGINFGFLSFKHTWTQNWTDTQSSSATYSLSTTATDSETVPGPSSSGLGVDHESDIIWIWLNPILNYTVTSPSTFVWNGFGVDANDPNSIDGAMDVIPLSVSQLDGTSPISEAEWEVLDRDWDPITSGGAGPITPIDLQTILARDAFAVNLSGVGPSSAPTTVPTGNLYPIFDPHVQSYDPVSGQCGNRYDFSPGFNLTFPYTTLGDTNQAMGQTYSLSTTSALSTSQTVTDTYKASLSAGITVSYDLGTDFGAPGGGTNLADWMCATAEAVQGSNPPASNVPGCPVAKNALQASLKFSGTLQWTNQWTNKQNNSEQESQTLTIKNPLVTDDYTGPTQIQVWKDNLYGTYMFYPQPSDTNWSLSASQTTVSAGSTITLTAMVSADPYIPYIPSGTVTFYDGCTLLGSEAINTGNGSVSINATMSSIGQHNIVAIYSGDTNFFHNSSNSVAVTVP